MCEAFKSLEFFAAFPLTVLLQTQVINNFGTTKGELSLKFRLGLEHALAKADFFNTPSLTLVQAFSICLALARRHDSPRFVWMMTGLAIRMAQSLGLHRDGSHFPQLTPYEIEIRRRVWWTLCFLDVRSSEDQGMDYTILPGSFDAKLPLNINDLDISIEGQETPAEGFGLTDMTMPIDMFKICDLTRRIMDKSLAPALNEQRRLVDELYATLEQGYLQHSQDYHGNVTRWMGSTAVRLTMAKMTLFINFPVLFSKHSEDLTTDTRNRLLVAAVEVAEWNHALNAEPGARQWRWIYQTYTHWHAIVILLIEIARRPLSPTVERAWLALRSSWLIPAQGNGWDKKLQIWVPLRRLMAAARKHRDVEIERLRGDAQAVNMTASKDSDVPIPASTCPFMSEEDLHRHWKSLFATETRGVQTMPRGHRQPGNIPHRSLSGQEEALATPPQQSVWNSLPRQHNLLPFRVTGTTSQNTEGSFAAVQVTESRTEAIPQPRLSDTMDIQREPVLGQAEISPYAPAPSTWPQPQHWSASAIPWLWADADPTTEVFGADLDINMVNESDWHNWLESAKNMELGPDVFR